VTAKQDVAKAEVAGWQGGWVSKPGRKMETTRDRLEKKLETVEQLRELAGERSHAGFMAPCPPH
jgi:hypothetical protein